MTQFQNDDNWQDLLDFCQAEQERLTSPDWEHCSTLTVAREFGDITIAEAAELLNTSKFGHFAIVAWGLSIVFDNIPPVLRDKFLRIVDPTTAIKILNKHRNELNLDEVNTLADKTRDLYPDMTVKIVNNNQSSLTLAELEFLYPLNNGS